MIHLYILIQDWYNYHGSYVKFSGEHWKIFTSSHDLYWLIEYQF